MTGKRSDYKSSKQNSLSANQTEQFPLLTFVVFPLAFLFVWHHSQGIAEVSLLVFDLKLS